MGKGIERREFLKVLGATGAGSSLLAGCRPNGADKLIPYVVPHEDIVPGVATWYHTTCRECPAGCGMSVRTREGRAVKAEGNPLSPISHGHLCARGQASLHGLYDPDRIPQALLKSGGNGESWDKTSWDNAEQRVYNAIAAQRGKTVMLTQTFTGTLDRLIDDWCAALGVERVRYDPFALEAVRAGYSMVFGGDAVPVHDFANADVVVTFGADFLETWVSPVDYANGWVRSHAYTQGRRGKLISITPHQSLTDMNADEWLNIRPGTEHIAALAIARLIVEEGRGQAGTAGAALGAPEVQAERAAQTCGVAVDRLRAVARDFARGGRSLAVGPGVSSSHRAGTAVAAAVAILNQVAGNIGTTVNITQREEHTRSGSYRGVQDLIARMRAGQVTVLLIYGPNPVYSLPEQSAVADALQKAEFVASFNSYLDETTSLAHVLLPDHHFLESWGDYVPRTGVMSLIQPVMSPVFNTKQTGDVLLSIAQRAGVQLPNAAPTFYDYLRGRWTREVLPGTGIAADAETGEDPWRLALKAGVVASATAATTAAAPATAQAAPAPATAQPAPAPATGQPAPALASVSVDVPTFTGDGEYHLVVYPSYRFWDGRLANRPWLQELPDPVSKFTWSSWIEVSPAAAQRLGLDTGHMATLRTDAGKTEPLPVFIHPGTRDDVVALQLGQGHTALGRYAQGRGVNALQLLQPEPDALSGGLVWFQAKAHLEPTGKWERPAQHGIHDDQENREIARTVTLSSARDADVKRGFIIAAGAPQATETHEEPSHGEGHGADVHPLDARVHQLQSAGGMTPVELDASPGGYPQIGMYYGEYTEAAPRWAMAIDLEKCIGCSACVTACYAENNIGIVGPQQVTMGRILHWIRIERYFEGGGEGEGAGLKTRFLPMLCQHCGNAPCEPVCPVYAAYHTPDGLNAQVYNRCVGTRYCANNCPYKVRVFNWYSWEWPEPLNWQLNPDVTVREKGVMEKCTFCVQRIRDAQNHARLEDRAVVDGEITPACAQTCPGEAIVFGNIKDANSRVARVAASGRGYRVLEELNTQSAITYLKRVELESSGI